MRAAPALERVDSPRAAQPGTGPCWVLPQVSPLPTQKVYLEELGGLLLELIHLPLVLAGVERGGRRGAGAAAVGPRAHGLHGVEVLHSRAPAAHPAAGVLAQRPHDALAAAVGALRGHPHLVHVSKHLQEGLQVSQRPVLGGGKEERKG